MAEAEPKDPLAVVDLAGVRNSIDSALFDVESRSASVIQNLLPIVTFAKIGQHIAIANYSPEAHLINFGVGALAYWAGLWAILPTNLKALIRGRHPLAQESFQTSDQDELQAKEDLNNTGMALGNIDDMPFDSRHILPQEFGEWHLAVQIRATKLFLAETGKLSEYQPGVWLKAVSVPESLKPTESELEEARQWSKQQREKTSKFVAELSNRDHVTIECGDELLAETTKVYLFHDEKDPFKNDALPLMDVMRGMAATDEEIKSVGFRNGMAFHGLDGKYEGIHSEKGRQRIADFFKKPVNFYFGAQVGSEWVKKYGVWEEELTMHDGLVINSLTPFPEFHYWEYAEPTSTKLERLGLELAST